MVTITLTFTKHLSGQRPYNWIWWQDLHTSLAKIRDIVYNYIKATVPNHVYALTVLQENTVQAKTGKHVHKLMWKWRIYYLKEYVDMGLIGLLDKYSRSALFPLSAFVDNTGDWVNSFICCGVIGWVEDGGCDIILGGPGSVGVTTGPQVCCCCIHSAAIIPYPAFASERIAPEMADTCRRELFYTQVNIQFHEETTCPSHAHLTNWSQSQLSYQSVMVGGKTPTFTVYGVPHNSQLEKFIISPNR